MLSQLVYRTLIFALLVAGGAACLSNRPNETIQVGDVLLRDRFESALGWDRFARDNVTLGVTDGAYRIYTDVDSYVRGFNSQTYDNVVIDVRVSQFSADENNAFGVVCRASTDNRGNGYYFLIGSDGSYSIRKGQFNELDPLIHWRQTNAVNEGVGVNNIRAICVENYLALYINGIFVDDIRDDKYSNGYIGFAAAAADGEVADVAFDELVVFEGRVTSSGQ